VVVRFFLMLLHRSNSCSCPTSQAVANC
jgi:hypothetical protein